MAIATLSSCYNNPMVFQGVVKIRKGQAVTLMMEATNMQAVQTIIFQYSQEVGVVSVPFFWPFFVFLLHFGWFSFPTDPAEGLPHWPIQRQDSAHSGCHPGKVHHVPVQDPPPVSNVPVCCHAAGCAQLAVHQYRCSPGAGHRRRVGGSFLLVLAGAHRLKSRRVLCWLPLIHGNALILRIHFGCENLYLWWWGGGVVVWLHMAFRSWRKWRNSHQTSVCFRFLFLYVNCLWFHFSD